MSYTAIVLLLFRSLLRCDSIDNSMSTDLAFPHQRLISQGQQLSLTLSPLSPTVVKYLGYLKMVKNNLMNQLILGKDK